MVTKNDKIFQKREKSFLKNRVNNQRLKLLNDNRLIKKYKLKHHRKNNLKLFIFKNERKKILIQNAENRNYDIYLLLKLIKKSKKNLGFNIPPTVFCQKNNIVCYFQYKKNKEINYFDLSQKKYKLTSIFSNIFKDKNYQSLIGKNYNDEILEFKNYQSHYKFLKSDNFNFLQILDQKFKKNEFLFEKKIFKHQNKTMANFARQIIYNEKYNLKKGTLNHIDKYQEMNYIQNLKNDNEFILFFTFKIYYFLKIFSQITFNNFSVTYLINKKKELTIIDFLPFRIKIKPTLLREEFYKNKKIDIKYVNFTKKSDEKLYIKKYDEILYNYYQKFSKKNMFKIDSKKNIKKIFKNTYKIIFKNISNNEKKSSFFKKKIDFQLIRHFQTFDENKIKTTRKSKKKNTFEKLNFLFKSSDIGIKNKRFKFFKKNKILKKYEKNKKNKENILPKISLNN